MIPRTYVKIWLLHVLIFAFAAVICGCGGGGGGTQGPPILAIFVSPATAQAYDGTSFSVEISASVQNTTAPVTVTLGSLPAGLSSTTKFPLTVPSTGAFISLSCSPTMAAGSYSLTVQGEASTATSSAILNLGVIAGTPPPFFFISPQAETDVPIGGSSQFQVSTGYDGSGTAPYQVALSLSGSPSGVTATINPQVITPGQSTTITMSAPAGTPDAQNVLVTLSGAPNISMPGASVSFLVDVMPPPGSIPDSKTDYLSTEGTPYAATFDPVHNVIYASNPSWNRVDIISNATHQILKSVDMRDPRGLGITVDGSLVAVATGSQQIFAINTSNYAVSRFLLPQYEINPGNGLSTWEGEEIFPLSDGTALLGITQATGGGTFDVVVWNPANNSLKGVKPPSNVPASWEILAPSGDGTRVYSIASDSGGYSFYYDVPTKTVSSAKQLGGYGLAAAVDHDGSRVAVEDSNGFNMYDGNLSLIGPIPGGGGNLLFSPDNKYLYVEGGPFGAPLILTINASTLQVVNEAPAMAIIPVMTEVSAPYLPSPFAVDSNGILLGVEDWGIAFDDSTYTVTVNAQDPGLPPYLQHMSPYFGPLAGGTTSGGFGNGFTITPSIWYGTNRGTATLQSEVLSITSPPSRTSGPVNLKFLFPDGIEVFDPLFFTYGSYPQYAVLSGAPPEGNVPGQISGYGIPYDSSGGKLSVGNRTATITSQAEQYMPLTGEPFPATLLNFTVPAGSPGWSDISVTTPSGSGTIPKSLFYAKSVTDYTSSDSFNAVLYDANRQQLYLSTQDHVDVFSLGSLSFVTPIKPPSQGTVTQFAGMSLMPNGKLLVTDLADGSLAVVDPDNSSNDYSIPISTPSSGGGSCQTGPLYVASSGTNQAFVVNGGIPALGCGPGGTLYQVNLTTKSAMTVTNFCGGGFVSSSYDGSVVALGSNPQGYGWFCTYNSATGTYYKNYAYQGYGAAVAGDGSIIGSQWLLSDANAELVGRVAEPYVYYANYSYGNLPSSFYLLQQPQMNISGSLYFLPYEQAFDIVDASHGRVRMRFSLSETISNVAAPMAIDSAGNNVYLLTNQGLTIVDLGSAPLSVGHVNPSAASAGTLVTLSGSGFAANTSVTVGGLQVGSTFVADTTLTFTMPALSSGPADIVLTNADGSTYTLQSAVTAK